MTLLVLFLVLSASTPSWTDPTECNELNIDVVKSGVMEYIDGKTFIDVFHDVDAVAIGVVSENLPACAWSTVSTDHKIVYRRKKYSRNLPERLFHRVVDGTFKTTVKEHPLTLSPNADGVIHESDEHGNTVSFVYPIYLNTDAGVYAYHRCKPGTVGGARKWTVITVDKAKFGSPPSDIKDATTLSEITTALGKIKSIQKIQLKYPEEANRKPDEMIWCVTHKRFKDEKRSGKDEVDEENADVSQYESKENDSDAKD